MIGFLSAAELALLATFSGTEVGQVVIAVLVIVAYFAQRSKTKEIHVLVNSNADALKAELKAMGERIATLEGAAGAQKA